VAALAAATLAGCGGSSDGVPGVIGSVRGFLGGATADEPRAALVARDILSAGGSAADAAVAAAFTLTVTYPGQMPFGGGGVCLVSTATGRLRTVDQISFPAVAARTDSTVATPGLPRGLFALHARYGKLRWEQALAPAENFARGGVQVTRAFAIDLVKNWTVVAADPALRALYSRDGQSLTEGQPLTQPLMATVLGNLRQRGPGELHTGATGRQLVAAANAAGIDLRFEDLAAGAPQLGSAFRTGGDVDFYIATPPATGSVAAGQIFSALESRWRATPAADRAASLLSTAAAASRDRAQWIGADLAATQALGDALAPARLRALANAGGAAADEPDTVPGTALAVIDRTGMAVACAFTGLRAFGIGKLPQGVGFLLAPAPVAGGESSRWLTAAIGVRDRRDVVFAGGASGGAAAPLALAQIALGTLADRQTLGAAIAAPRAAGDGDTRVQAVHCPEGLADSPATCRIETDPRGAGFATGSQ
jgi:gamma-glutamyltranspeptidase/glutathione hydrolase